MKALVLTTSYPLTSSGLGGRFVHELVDGLGRNGWRFDVVTPAGPPGPRRSYGDHETVMEARYAGWSRYPLVHGAGIPEELAFRSWKWVLVPGLLAAWARAARRRLHAERYDLIWSHWLFPAGWLGARLGRRFRVPHICTAHGSDVHYLERAVRLPGVRRFLLRSWADTVLTAPVQHTASRVTAALRGREVRTLGLVAGEPAERWGADPERGRSCLFLGRFERIKGADLLLGAVERLRGSFPGEVVLAGAGSCEGALRHRVAERSLPVRFVGVLNGVDKLQAIRRAQALIVPSRTLRGGRREGLPHAAMEAWVQGTPVIAPREGALGEWIERTGSGIAFDSGDKDEDFERSLASAILRSYEDDDRWSEVRRQAREGGRSFCQREALSKWESMLGTLVGRAV